MYHPDSHNFDDLRDNSVYSASLLFIPQPHLLRLGGKKRKHNRSPHTCMAEVDIEHQESMRLDEKEEFDFVVLMVNDGTPVKVTSN